MKIYHMDGSMCDQKNELFENKKQKFGFIVSNCVSHWSEEKEKWKKHEMGNGLKIGVW